MRGTPKRFITALVRWFDANERDLPWRHNRTGYTTLVAEAMLQQTQVSRVAERFEQFIQRFPTVHDLAEADEQDVLTLWQGLGYYRRARHVHAAAQMIVEQFNGNVPSTVADLQRLPGVGRYTAGAIASMAYNQPTPIVDGNVYRVLARLHEHNQPASDRDALKWAWATAESLAAATDQPGRVNEALMELGATVCTPRAPRCDACPVSQFCRAHHNGRAESVPPAKTPTARRTVHHHAVVMRRSDQVLIEKRPANGLWSNMWQVPTIESDRRLSDAELRERLPMNVHRLDEAGTFQHETTHRRIQFHVFEGRTRARRGVWQPLAELDQMPLSNAQRRVVELVCPQR